MIIRKALLLNGVAANLLDQIPKYVSVLLFVITVTSLKLNIWQIFRTEAIFLHTLSVVTELIRSLNI
jgi:hypothetical protein